MFIVHIMWCRLKWVFTSVDDFFFRGMRVEDTQWCLIGSAGECKINWKKYYKLPEASLMRIEILN